MSMKIHVSYTEDGEAQEVETLLKPISHRFKVKKSTGTYPYKHLYFTPRKPQKLTKYTDNP